MKIGKRINSLLDKVFVGRCYQRVFSTEEGQIVLADLLRQGFVFVPTYVQGDPVETAHREGARRFALSIARRAKLGNPDIERIMDEMNEQSTAKRGD